MADGCVVFIDEDHDAFAIFQRVFLGRLARLVGERVDRIAEIEREVLSVVVVESYGGEPHLDIFGKSLVEALKCFRRDVVEGEMDYGVLLPLPARLVDGEAGEQVAPALEDILEGRDG